MNLSVKQVSWVDDEEEEEEVEEEEEEGVEEVLIEEGPDVEEVLIKEGSDVEEELIKEGSDVEEVLIKEGSDVEEVGETLIEERSDVEKQEEEEVEEIFIEDESDVEEVVMQVPEDELRDDGKAKMKGLHKSIHFKKQGVGRRGPKFTKAAAVTAATAPSARNSAPHLAKPPKLVHHYNGRPQLTRNPRNVSDDGHQASGDAIHQTAAAGRQEDGEHELEEAQAARSSDSEGVVCRDAEKGSKAIRKLYYLKSTFIQL